MKKYKVLGLSKNSKYENEKRQTVEVTNLFLKKGNQKYVAEFKLTEGICDSGYCSAQWLDLDLKEVDYFTPIQFVPKIPFSISDVYRLKDYSDYIFICSNNDFYYPTATFYINENMWVQTNRKEEFGNPIYVFYGESATGKSSMALKLFDQEDIIETDVFDDPKEIYEKNYNICLAIVIGNRHKNFKEEIYPNLEFKREVIEIEFKKVH